VRIETFYNENKDQFYQEDKVHMRMIQLTREDRTDAQLKAEADLISSASTRAKIRDLAKEFSRPAIAPRAAIGAAKNVPTSSRPTANTLQTQEGRSHRPIILPEGCFLPTPRTANTRASSRSTKCATRSSGILVTQMSHANQERWLERLRRNGYVKTLLSREQLAARHRRVGADDDAEEIPWRTRVRSGSRLPTPIARQPSEVFSSSVCASRPALSPMNTTVIPARNSPSPRFAHEHRAVAIERSIESPRPTITFAPRMGGGKIFGEPPRAPTRQPSRPRVKARPRELSPLRPPATRAPRTREGFSKTAAQRA